MENISPFSLENMVPDYLQAMPYLMISEESRLVQKLEVEKFIKLKNDVRNLEHLQPTLVLTFEGATGNFAASMTSNSGLGDET